MKYINYPDEYNLIIIIIIIRNLYSAIMPLGGYRGAVPSQRYSKKLQVGWDLTTTQNKYMVYIGQKF